MRNTIICVLFLSLVAGCAGSPPKPPEAKGEYRPINRIEPKPSATQPDTLIQQTFDFTYEGDIVDSLYALQNAQPQLTILPTLGKRIPLLVRVNLRAVTLEDALRTLGEQGGRSADVVWNKSQGPGGNQVFIRFHTNFYQPKTN